MNVYHLYLYCSLHACSLVERSQEDGTKGYTMADYKDGSRHFVPDEEIERSVPEPVEPVAAPAPAVAAMGRRVI